MPPQGRLPSAAMAVPRSCLADAYGAHRSTWWDVLNVILVNAAHAQEERRGRLSLATSRDCKTMGCVRSTEERVVGRDSADVDNACRQTRLSQGYCVLGALVTALMRSSGRRLARRVARAMLVSPLLRW